MYFITGEMPTDTFPLSMLSLFLNWERDVDVEWKKNMTGENVVIDYVYL